jgi:hypothetical protein
MYNVKKWFFTILYLAVISLLRLPCAESQQGYTSMSGSDASVASGAEHAPAYPSMPGPGKKVSIDKDDYFIYSFDKKPKLGTTIMKVQLSGAGGKKESSLEVRANVCMPSMRGAHDTGDRPFRLSKTGDYLLPIDIVMPGDWEIRLTFLKDGKVIFRGSYQFYV